MSRSFACWILTNREAPIVWWITETLHETYWNIFNWDTMYSKTTLALASLKEAIHVSHRSFCRKSTQIYLTNWESPWGIWNYLQDHKSKKRISVGYNMASLIFAHSWLILLYLACTKYVRIYCIMLWMSSG